MKLPLIQKSVKEAIDHLPSGICFFDKNGMLVLCNMVMHRLAFALTGCDLQTMSDFASTLHTLPEHSTALQDEDAFLLSDGTVWQFSNRTVNDVFGNTYTEYVAVNITELSEKQKELRHSNAEQKKLAAHMRRIIDNVTAIVREEEILSMKMRIHNQVGWCLQSLRQYYAGGCLAEEKGAIVTMLSQIIECLQGEIGHDDDLNLLEELRHAATALGVHIVTEGILPKDENAETLIVAAIRECVINTLRHAGGNQVWVVLTNTYTSARALITNNGRQPQKPIIEGGGFTSLRQRIEKAGGAMTVQSLPHFALAITLPLKGGNDE